jgi:hypothetical protein
MSEEQKSIREIIKEEYKKCLLSPAYFMKKYCMIEHQQRGQILFNLFKFQERTLEQFKNNRFNIVLKSRQMGISTLCAGYSLWLMTFHESKNIIVIATTQDTAKNLVTKVRFMHKNLPSWLKVPDVEDNKLSLKLKNESQIKAASSSSDSARSYACALLIIDEAAAIENADEIWTAAQQTLSTGGDAIILSTPMGVGNFFHKMWVAAEARENEFNTVKLKWDLHPERDQTWRDEQDKLLGPKRASQECDTSFLSSGNTVVDMDIILFYKETYIKEPLEKRGFDKNYWIWQYPDPLRQYLVSADVSRGDSSDFSTFQILDVESLQQVAEYKGKVPTKDFGNMLISVATEYNNALLIVENSNIGWAAIQQIIDRQYANLFYSSTDLQYVDVEHQMTNKIHREEKKMIPGFTTSNKSRPLMISKLESYFREKSVVVNSSRLIEELFVFIWNNNKAEAMKGYNDDLVMAFAIGLWIRDTTFRLRADGINLQRTIIDKIGKTESPDAIYTSKAPQYNPYELNVGTHKENLTWLL